MVKVKLSRMKGNHYGDGVTVLKSKYPRLSSGDTNIHSADNFVTFYYLAVTT